MPDQDRVNEANGRSRPDADQQRPIQVVRIARDSGLLQRFWAVARASILHPLTTTRFVEDPVGARR